MSVSYDRVNWADYPATTTPVNATNLNKMDKGIADLTREVNSVESSVSNLNSSLDDIDIRYNSTTGKPEWRERGAGSFVPFDSGIVKGIVCRYQDTYSTKNYIVDSDGTCHTSTVYVGTYTDNCDFITLSMNGSSVHYGTILKDGYYYISGLTTHIQYYEANQTLPGYYGTYVYYFGETNPFE